MFSTESIQGHIEITRRHIINQLKDEITHFEQELVKISRTPSSEAGDWGFNIYTKLINRKRQLISSLS